MHSDREQKLVDITFSMIMLIHSELDSFKKLSREEMAAWVARQLKDCGFPTEPIGSSWGVLTSRLNKD